MPSKLYGPLLVESQRYWRWACANPPEPMEVGVAKEGAGSELRTPLFHFGTVMPVYLSVMRYLAREKTLKGKRLVELGSGSGRALSYLQAMFPDLAVVGTDYSSGCIEYAKRVYGMYGVEFVHTPAQRTILRAGSFDYVISSHVIEHLTKEDGLAFVKESVRLLKKGGTAFIGTPERRMSQNIYAKNPTDKRGLRLVPPHEHEYVQGELLALGKAVGTKVRVEKLLNPVFRKIIIASINKFRPGTSLKQKTANLLYRLGRDYAPKLLFDGITKWGARLTMQKLGVDYQTILRANKLAKSSDKRVADNLLLVIKK